MMDLAKTDALTGLHTYNILLDHLEKLLLSPGEHLTGLLFLELEDPSHFNDAFGYNADKHILLQAVEGIASLLDNEHFSRVGTYSFVIVLENLSSSDDLMVLAQKIINFFREPLSFQENLLYMTAAIGIAYTQGKEKCETVSFIKQAEHAMREAQRMGINRIVVSSGESVLSYSQELRILQELPYAIEREDIYFVYQGQYCYKDESFKGAEILLRWEHPELGNIPPSVFIPLSEKSGMITPLMTRTLVEASSMFKKLQLQGIDTFSLSINLPFQVLMEESFIDTVAFLLDAYELKGKRLTFEIMEDTIPDHLESFTSRLDEIKALGFMLAVDDYGTGHTSLTYLQHFPVDFIKIDRSFITNIGVERKRFLLFKSIIDMAKALDLKVIAEGVETEEEDVILRKHFSDLTVQGFLYSKPSRAEDFLKALS
jgi:diguanylate cyclase (GGDEF)-like protein